jgi:hypothetical protein
MPALSRTLGHRPHRIDDGAFLAAQNGPQVVLVLAGCKDENVPPPSVGTIGLS